MIAWLQRRGTFDDFIFQSRTDHLNKVAHRIVCFGSTLSMINSRADRRMARWQLLNIARARSSSQL